MKYQPVDESGKPLNVPPHKVPLKAGLYKVIVDDADAGVAHKTGTPYIKLHFKLPVQEGVNEVCYLQDRLFAKAPQRLRSACEAFNLLPEYVSGELLPKVFLDKEGVLQIGVRYLDQFPGTDNTRPVTFNVVEGYLPMKSPEAKAVTEERLPYVNLRDAIMLLAGREKIQAVVLGTSGGPLIPETARGKEMTWDLAAPLLNYYYDPVIDYDGDSNARTNGACDFTAWTPMKVLFLRERDGCLYPDAVDRWPPHTRQKITAST